MRGSELVRCMGVKILILQKRPVGLLVLRQVHRGES